MGAKEDESSTEHVWVSGFHHADKFSALNVGTYYCLILNSEGELYLIGYITKATCFLTVMSAKVDSHIGTH
jgi:hypothetical protein